MDEEAELAGDEEIDPEILLAAMVPHYQHATQSSIAPEYLNEEAEMIYQGFNKGNFTELRTALPLEIAADQLTLLRKHRMESNRITNWARVCSYNDGRSCTTRGVFYPEFDYIAEAPDHMKHLIRHETRAHKKKQKKISDKEWAKTGSRHVAKYEAQFKSCEVEGPSGPEGVAQFAQALRTSQSPSSRALSEYKEVGYPYLSPQIKPEFEKARQDRFSFQEDKIFICGKGQGLNDGAKSSRAMLPLMVKRLRQKIEADWEDSTVAIHATDQDLLEISFFLESVDSELGVFSYMNLLSLVDQFGLRKVSQLWGVKKNFEDTITASQGTSRDGAFQENRNTWIFFLFAPQWVKMRVTDAYYTTHPREAGSLFRMSVAGSSILYSLSQTDAGASNMLETNEGLDDGE